jgi:hypothetical protein
MCQKCKKKKYGTMTLLKLHSMLFAKKKSKEKRNHHVSCEICSSRENNY